MSRGCKLTEKEKKTILDLRKKKKTYREIGLKINRSKTVVGNFLKNPVTFNKKKRSGRRKKINERTKRLIIREVSNKATSCSKIIDDLSLKVSRWTINRTLNESRHLIYKKKKKTPALTDLHKQARLKWAKEHMTWKSEWKQVVWSDEKKFNLDGPDGLSYYWHDLRKEEEIFSKRSHGGGSLMIWASFGWNGKSEICFIDNKLNAEGYRKILKDHLVGVGAIIGGNNWLFQQDNAPVHRAKVNLTWFKSNKIDVIQWPSLSPDLNPIENLWGLLTRKVYANGKQYSNKEELKKSILKCWNQIELKDIQKLTESMPNRIFEVILLNGQKTKY